MLTKAHVGLWSPAVCVEVGLLVFLGVVRSNIWRKRGRRDGTERRGRREEGHSMVQGLFWKEFFHPCVTSSLRKGRVNVSGWLPEWCVLYSQVFVLRQLLRWQKPQITGMGPARLTEVRLSQAVVYVSWWSESPWLAQSLGVGSSKWSQSLLTAERIDGEIKLKNCFHVLYHNFCDFIYIN